MSQQAIAIDVDLELLPGADPHAPGGAVTAELCGHWEHDGPCRWPHNNEIDADAVPARLRTIVVTSDDDRVEVLRRIEGALRNDDRWRVTRFGVRAVADAEQAIAARLTHVG